MNFKFSMVCPLKRLRNRILLHKSKFYVILHHTMKNLVLLWKTYLYYYNLLPRNLLDFWRKFHTESISENFNFKGSPISLTRQLYIEGYVKLIKNPYSGISKYFQYLEMVSALCSTSYIRVRNQGLWVDFFRHLDCLHSISIGKMI